MCGLRRSPAEGVRPDHLSGPPFLARQVLVTRDAFVVSVARVNAENIRQCLIRLRDSGYQGVLSIECEGQGGPMIEQSLAWLRATLAELKIDF